MRPVSHSIWQWQSLLLHPPWSFIENRNCIRDQMVCPDVCTGNHSLHTDTNLAFLAHLSVCWYGSHQFTVWRESDSWRRCLALEHKTLKKHDRNVMQCKSIYKAFTPKVSAVSTPLWWISKTRHIKKLVTHVGSRARAVSLLESREQHYIKMINKNVSPKPQCSPTGLDTSPTPTVVSFITKSFRAWIP